MGCRPVTVARQEQIAKAAAQLTTETLVVLNKDNNVGVVKALQASCTNKLILTYGPSNDEAALVRDSHRAADLEGECVRPILKLAVYNMYQACMRLKHAHDAKYNPKRRAGIGGMDETQKKQQFGLDAMYTHFVESNGRHFVTPSPEGILQS